MTTKKHRKQSTKRLKEPAPPMPPTKQTGGIWKYLRIFWIFWSVLSTILTFVLGYFALRPSLIIDYASHLIPDNPIALPIKVSNVGLLPIYNVICKMDADITDLNNNHVKSREIELLTKYLGHNKSIDHIYHAVKTNQGPKTGYVIVTLSYELPIIYKTYYEKQKFIFSKSKDGNTRWRLVQ